ncbi:MAG: DUF2474 family protein [Halofilum sp. (in: g-proteobacteria)]|nr:DUF2474 family protein [Halofilum sp. (in: g-proteobacteria)]
MSARDDPPRSLGRRLGWFAALWVAGVAVVVVVAYGIRLLMP